MPPVGAGRTNEDAVMAEITTDKPQQTAKSKGLSDRQKDIIQKFAAVGSLIILAAIFSVTSSAFMTVNNAMTIALQVTSIALLGIGATYVIITGGIDLSVGSVLALAGVVAARSEERRVGRGGAPRGW